MGFRRIVSLLLLSGVFAQAIAQWPLVVVTRDDLLEMAAAELPVTLMVRTIENADRVPVLQPKDLIELSGKGVPAEVLEAVVAKMGEIKPAQPARPAQPEGRRRIRVAARLEDKQKWYRNPLGRGKDFAVYWAVAIDGPDDAEKLAVEQCPKQTVCWCAAADGGKQCVGPKDELWRRYFSCLRILEMEVGSTHDVFDFHLDRGVEEIRILPLLMVREKDGVLHLEAWQTTTVGSGDFEASRRPGYISIRPGSSRDYTVEVDVGLELAGSARTDLRVLVTRGDNRDPDAEWPLRPVRVRAAGRDRVLPAGLADCAIE